MSTRPSRRARSSIESDAALDATIARIRDKLVAWLTRRYGRDNAEDFAHTAILRALRKRKSYVPRLGKFETWLFGIAKNAAIDEMRRRGKIEFTSLDMLTEDVVPSVEGPAEQYERKARNTRLYKALRRVPPEMRFPVILHCLRGYTYTVISARLNIKPEQARYQVKKGLAALSVLLRE
jgi:RNA polymerase sigma-70 factor, ECF subfamily